MTSILAGSLTAVLMMTNCDSEGCMDIVSAKYYGPAGNQFCQEAASHFNRNRIYEQVTRYNVPVTFSCKSVAQQESMPRPRM